MRIAIVTNRFLRSEGQGRVNYEIARIAAERGHNVACIAHEVHSDLHVHPRISWVHMPDAEWPMALTGTPNFARATTRWLRKYNDQFDVTLANGFNTWFPVDINVVHFVHTAWRQSPVHDARIRSGPLAWYQWLYSWLNAHLERRVIPQAQAIVAVSAKVKRELITAGIPAKSIQVIHNGVDTDEFQLGPTNRTDLGLPPRVPLAFFAGDIRTPRKNLDSVLHALRDVPHLHLAIAGSTDRSPFPSLARRLGLDERVHFLGFRKDVPELMRAVDFFVFPSRYEACSLVLLEAMASGLPIVTARTAGGAELVKDDCGIVLDDPDDTEKLTHILRVLTQQTDRRDQMSRKARANALKHTWATMAEEYLALMEQLCPQTSCATN
jgi:glycosyltransferase involved in cell wall biosynthesis